MDIEEFLDQSELILDVRSPLEFAHSHVPGAHSFPLFSDAERAHVGTVYKTEGKDAAVKLGLGYVGPKLSSFVENAEKLVGPTRTFRMYCFRGGMRSGSLAWLLQTAGFRCIVLTKGYKAFRRWALNQFTKEYRFIVLGGLTGSGKTDLLRQLKQQGEQIIDLEAIAEHRGSSFGHIGCAPQPSSEHFENILACKLAKCDPRLPIWIEDESRMIGTCHIPPDLWKQMSQAPFVWIQSPKEDRVKRLLESYGQYSVEDLSLATQRLVRKLGAVRTNQIVECIGGQEIERAISSLLDYYDQTYTYSRQRLNRKRTEYGYSGMDQELLDRLKSFSEQRLEK